MKKFFFAGICGISMSALAVMVHNLGYSVCGSDRNYKNPPKCLIENNILVVDESDTKQIINADFVVFSSAIKEDNKIFLLAKKLNKKCFSRGEILGAIAKQYEKVIAVAGSHGKTTTTAMIYHILWLAGENPSLHLGGIYDGTNVVCGGKKYLVCEACEYHDNFLYLYPYISVVTNIEREHLDYFKTFAREKESFELFKKQSKFVIDSIVFPSKNVRINKWGGVSFSLNINGKAERFNLRVGGFYNVKNASYAIQTCLKIGVPLKVIKLALQTFKGTRKRLENVDFCGRKIIVDYAHHPTEILNTYNFLKKLNKKITLVFQPHTFSRTKDFLNDFIKVLTKFDNLYLYKTYSARETPCEGISAKQLCDIIKKAGKKPTYIYKEKDVCNLIKKSFNDEIIVLMGAGDLPEKLGIYD